MSNSAVMRSAGATMRVMLNLLLVAQAFIAPVMPAETVSMRACVWGDNQAGVPVFRQIVAAMERERPDFLLTTGDVIQNRGAIPGEWATQFLEPLAPILHLPRFGCLGNHCEPTGFMALVNQHVTAHLPGGLGLWGAVTIGGARILFMDSNQESLELRTSMMAGGPQRAWLEAQIALPEWRAARWRICMWHAPPSTELWTGACYYLRTDIAHAPWLWAMDRIARSGGDLLLCGHAHGYQRGAWGEMALVVTGGGGGGLDSACCPNLEEIQVALAVHHYVVLDMGEKALTVTAKNVQGQTIDEVTIR